MVSTKAFLSKFLGHGATAGGAKNLKNIERDHPGRNEAVHIFLPDFFRHHQNKNGVNIAEITIIFCLSLSGRFWDNNRNNREIQRLKKSMMVRRKSSGKIMGVEFFLMISLESTKERKSAMKSNKITSVIHARMNFCIICDQA